MSSIALKRSCNIRRGNNRSFGRHDPDQRQWGTELGDVDLRRYADDLLAYKPTPRCLLVSNTSWQVVAGSVGDALVVVEWNRLVMVIR